jgi:tetratricopeptide (TPR) repeat protein
VRFLVRKDPVALLARGDELAERGDHDGAIAAYRRAVGSGHPKVAAEAGVRLGTALRRSGEPAKAAAAYRAVMSTGDPDQTPRAAYLLGEVLTDTSRFDEAVAAYEVVIGTDHELRPDALLRLAEVQWFDLHDSAAAITTYERAIDTGDPETAPSAMLGLADLLCDDAPERAADLYRRAAASGHAEAAPAARQALRQLRS